MKNLPITPFNEGNVAIILKSIGFELDENKRLIYRGKVRNCECCNSELSIKNIGNIFPGSHHLFCDNPFCITSYVRERFLKV